MDSSENDVLMEPEEKGDELDQLLYAADDDNIDDELSESVVTKVVIRNSSQKEQKLTLEEQSKQQLYQSLDVVVDDNKKVGNWRLNVVHVRGVQEMSSEDVLAYFNVYEPSSIEWVNDLSCNVVFDDEDVAAYVIKDTTTAVVFKGNKYKFVEQPDVEVINGDTLETSIPPGRWRLGKPHEKAKILLFRFATISDKKVKGARKFSQYYLKYGFNDENRNQVEREDDSDLIVKQFRRRINVDAPSTTASSGTTKLMRMRMRADDEEDKSKRKTKPSLKIQFTSENSSRDVTTNEKERVSIWDRLDSDQEPEERSTVYSVFGHRARRTVWARLQKPRVYESFQVNDLRSKISENRNRRLTKTDPY